MSYVLEEINQCTKKLVFNFETLDLSSEIKTAITKKQKTASFKGFRKGKAPISMVEKFYKPEIEMDAINSFVEKELFEAIKKEDFRVVGQPAFANMKYEPGESASFDVTVEIFPVVEVKDMSSLKFNKDKVELTEEDVATAIKSYLEPKSELLELEGDVKLEKGQTAVLNFEGVKEDGEAPENMKGEDFVLEIGSNQFIPGFEEGMIGMKKSEKKDIKLSFPEDYHAEELKGAKVTFKVELLEIKEKKYPELTDELAVEFGSKDLTDFNEKNKTTLLKQKERASREKLNQEILQKLIEENPFDVPVALLAQQETHVKEEVKGTLTQQGFTPDMMEEYFVKWKDDLLSKADFQVRSGLILDTLGRKFEVEVAESDFDEKIEEMAAGTGMAIEDIKKYYNSTEKVKENIRYAIREEKTFLKICEVVTVTEK